LDANLIGTVVPCFDNDIAAGANFVTILDANDPACAAPEAGSVTIDTDGMVVVSGNNTDTGFLTAFVLTDTDGNIIQFNTDGNFDLTGLADGDYNAYSYNVVEAEVGGDLDAFITAAGSVGSLQMGIDNGTISADLSDPSTLTIGTALCDAEAGSLTGDVSGFYCASSSIAVGADGFNAVDFVQLYVLTLNDADFTIVSINTDGAFDALAPGSYVVHAANIDAVEAAPINLDDLIGLSAVTVLTGLTCWDLETAISETVVFEPVVVTAADYDCNEEIGEYTQGYSFSGGLPQYAIENSVVVIDANDIFYNATGDLDGQFEVTSNEVIVYTDNSSFSVTATDNFGCTADTTGTPETPCTKTAIELLRFDGKVRGTGNELNWATASEENNEAFILQRSTDGVNFETIAEINGAGTTNASTSYSFLDKTFVSADNFYRLLARELGAAAKEASDVIILTRPTAGFELVSAAPIPADKDLTFTFDTAVEQEITISIYNTAGQLVAIQQVASISGRNYTIMDVADFAGGTYIANIANGTEVFEIKFVKK